MILRPHWWLMLNNMSSCNVLTRRWVKTSLAKMILLGLSTASSWNWRWFQRDGHWQGYLSRCRHVWITSTACWRDAAGKYKPHVLHPLNHLPPYTRWRNVWPWSWLSTWPKRLPPFSERFWHTRPRSCTTTVRCIYFAPITGYSRFTRNYCTHRPAARLPGNVKENDPAVAWHAYAKPPKQRRHEFQWLDWRYLSGGYLTGMVSCPLGPSGVATAAEEGGQILGRAPVLDGRGSGSSGHSQAMAGGSG